MLLRQTKMGLFEGYVSSTTIFELSKVKDGEYRNALLSLLEDFALIRLKLHPNEVEEVQFLADLYIKKGIIPSEKIDDAIHFATMVVRPDLSILVTWNCKHLANINIERKVKAITLQEGYDFNFRVATPEEVIVYGQE